MIGTIVICKNNLFRRPRKIRKTNKLILSIEAKYDYLRKEPMELSRNLEENNVS